MKCHLRKSENLENGICIDWLEFTIKNCLSPYEAISFLGLDPFDFQEGFSRYGYKHALKFQHIDILYGGRDDMGVHVIMTGQGCRSFEQYSHTSTFDMLLKDINSHENISMSRLDVAYDDFQGLIDLDSILDDISNGCVVSRFKSANIISSYDICKSDVKHTTLNFGRQGSNTWVTIYDKKAERQSKDIMVNADKWVRCEIKMRSVNADRFVALFSEGKLIDELYFLVLNNYLRFVVPSDDKNKSRWATAPHWARFCNSVVNDSISLFVAPSDNYDVYKLEKYVVGQAGAAVYTYIQRFGIKDFMEKIDDKKYRLTQKYLELLTIPEKLEDDQELV